jgi:hypothetical protein
VFVSCRFSHLIGRSSVNPPSLEDFVPNSWTGLNYGQGAIAGSLASRKNVVVVASRNRTTSPRILRRHVEAHFLFPICHCKDLMQSTDLPGSLHLITSSSVKFITFACFPKT